MPNINKNLVSTTLIIVVVICSIFFIYEWKWDEWKILVGSGIGILSGFYIEILNLKATFSGKQIWRIVIFCLVLSGLLFTQLLSTYLFLGYIVSLSIGFLTCNGITKYIEQHK